MQIKSVITSECNGWSSFIYLVLDIIILKICSYFQRDMTPLHYAVHSSTDVAMFLIEKGAKVDYKDCVSYHKRSFILIETIY